MDKPASGTHRPLEVMQALASRPCPVCGASDSRLLGMDGEFRVEKCLTPDCGLVYANPRPTPQGLEVFYQTYFSESDDAPDALRNENLAIMEDVCTWIMQGRDTPGDLLDVGCAFGQLLQMAHAQGWRTQGVEPSANAAAHAVRVAGGPVQACGIEDAVLEPESVDAVVSLYVLEHVVDPMGMMHRIHEVLRPGGQAVIRVPWVEPLMPVFRAMGRPLIQAPMHLNDFSPTVMRRIASDLGFARVDVDPGRPRRSTELVEWVGATVLGNVAYGVHRASGGRVLFPYAGSYSYRFHKP